MTDSYAYLVLHARGGLGFAGLDADAAHAYARTTEGVVVQLPIVADYRSERAVDDPKCTCELIDVSTVSEPSFVRGLSRGCEVHPAGEYERRLRERQDVLDAQVEVAKRRAREAP